MTDIASRFLLANLAAAVAVLVVLLIRKPARRLFGARFAYVLWLLVPLASIASLIPRVVEVVLPAPALQETLSPSPAPIFDAAAPVPITLEQAAATPLAQPMSLDPWALGWMAWFAGAVTMAMWLAYGQSRFLADARKGRAGPAVVGVLRPRIVVPSDFEERFEPKERDVILAHEAIHLSRRDAHINALLALVRCVCWFNPMIHIGAYFARIDQELACDAAVAERHPKAKAVYASALLKAQLAMRPLPLGCYWPAGTEHPLTERIEMLKQAAPGRIRKIVGSVALAMLGIGAGVTAWAAAPAKEHVVVLDTLRAEPAADVAVDFSSLVAPERALVDAPLDQPAPAPAPQTPPSSQSATADEPVFVRGKIEKIDFSDTTYVIQLHASSTGRDTSSSSRPTFWGEKVNTAVWRLSPVNYFGARESIEKDLLGREVVVRGNTSSGLSCASACAIKVRELVVPKSTAVPAPGGRPFTIADFAMYYDTTQPMLMSGKVERLEFAETTFDAWIETTGYGVDPGVLYQVRSEYFLPRADIEARLRNQDIVVSGWPARGDYHQMCRPVCGMYAEMMWLADGTPLKPGSTRQISPPPAAPFAAGGPADAPQRTSPLQPQPTRFEPPNIAPELRGLPWILQERADAKAPLSLRGVVTSVEWVNPATRIHLREDGTGKAWIVETSTPNTLLRLGVTRAALHNGIPVTARGFAPLDKTYAEACLMYASPSAMTFSGAAPKPQPQPASYEPQQAAPIAAPPASSDAQAQSPRTVPQTPADISQTPIFLQSDQGQYLQDEGRGVYVGNVQMTQGDSRLTTDHLTAICQHNSQGECEEIRTLTAEGNVVYNSPSISIRGDHAEYDYAAAAITITGDVTIKRGDSGVVRSEKAIYDVNKKRITFAGDPVTSKTTPN